MQSNPIVEKQEKEEAERRAKEAYRYPIRLVCVFKDYENNDYPVILESRKYCNENNIVFVARQYNLDKYEEDCDIKRLPAFHLYYKGGHDQIQYFDTNPIQHVQKLVWEFEDEEKKKERLRKKRQEQWEAFKATLIPTWSFKRKPALDLELSLSHTPNST